jgi:hypothetical protein
VLISFLDMLGLALLLVGIAGLVTAGHGGLLCFRDSTSAARKGFLRVWSSRAIHGGNSTGLRRVCPSGS